MTQDRTPARIVRAWDETPAMRAFELDAGSLCEQQKVPGQFVQAETGGHSGTFALTNEPGAPLELLVKRGGEVADAICALGEGDTLSITTPAGKGFDADAHVGKGLLLFAAGSGIAPLRAVLRFVVGRRKNYKQIRLYYGQRHASEFAYQSDLVAWREADVDVVQVVSGDDAGWSGARGHVQDALAADPPPVQECIAFVCGMKPMVAAVKESLGAMGMPENQVLLNF